MGFPKAHRLSFPSQPPTAVPVLIVSGEMDPDDPKGKNAWSYYRQTGATKLIFEVKGGDHYTPVGPSGGTESEAGSAGEAALCNCLSVLGCLCLCKEFPQCWCAPCPCIGTPNGPSGPATDHAARGAIGGVALAWLRLFLLGDENARSQLVLRPDIASGFECSGVAVPMAMDR